MPTAPRHRPDGGLRERSLEPRAVALGLEGEAGQLDAERGRLGVDPVGAPGAQRVDVRAGAGGQRLHQPPRVGQDQLADLRICSASPVSSTSVEVSP